MPRFPISVNPSIALCCQLRFEDHIDTRESADQPILGSCRMTTRQRRGPGIDMAVQTERNTRKRGKQENDELRQLRRDDAAETLKSVKTFIGLLESSLPTRGKPAGQSSCLPSGASHPLPGLASYPSESDGKNQQLPAAATSRPRRVFTRSQCCPESLFGRGRRHISHPIAAGSKSRCADDALKATASATVGSGLRTANGSGLGRHLNCRWGEREMIDAQGSVVSATHSATRVTWAKTTATARLGSSADRHACPPPTQASPVRRAHSAQLPRSVELGRRRRRVPDAPQCHITGKWQALI